MNLKIRGIVREVLDVQSGSGAKGGWRKREFILETKGDYPKKICMVQWGDHIDNQAIGIGEDITVSIDISSREHGGRWYTDVKAWKVEREAAAPAATMMGGHTPAEPIAEKDDDLPF